MSGFDAILLLIVVAVPWFVGAVTIARFLFEVIDLGIEARDERRKARE